MNNDDIWGITTFFNPANYKSKKENYNIFRKSSKRQGLRLIAIELKFDDYPFELKKNDAEIVIQIRTQERNILWQKEALLNIGLKKLPNECKKVIWIDCDIVFQNEKWVKKTSELLEKYKVVQPFSYCVKLSKGIASVENIDNLEFGLEEMKKIHGIVFGFYTFKDFSFNEYIKHGHVGFVWAIRRDIIEKNGFYDHAISGSGDLIMSSAFLNLKPDYFKKNFPIKMVRHFEKWVKKISNYVKGETYYVDGFVYHLWHGDTKNRYYDNRHEILFCNNFDPNFDIVKNENNIWEWSNNKRKLKSSIKKYFWLRREDRGFLNFLIFLKNKIL